MKAILGIMFLLVVLWCACGCVSGESKYDPQDTVQKPLPDSILVRDTGMKDMPGKSDIDSQYDTIRKHAGGDKWIDSITIRKGGGQ